MAPKELNFITGNRNKLAEVQAILSETPVQLQSQNVDLVEIQGTIEQISTDKCRRAADAVCISLNFFLRREWKRIFVTISRWYTWCLNYGGSIGKVAFTDCAIS